MKPEELRPVKIGYQDGLGNVESVEAYTADQLSDAIEAAMDAAETSDICSAEWRAKISELRRK